MIYLQKHLEFLFDQLVEAYQSQSFDEFEKLKKQISSLKALMNSKDRIISENQLIRS
jgi:predicted helicase